MNKEQIGSFILEERKRQNLSQQQLAEKAGFNRRQQITEIEKSQFDYGIEVLIKVLNALGYKPAFEQIESVTTKTITNVTSTFNFDFSKAEPAQDEETKIIKKEKVTQPFKRKVKRIK